MYFLHRLSVHINITKMYHAGGRQSEKQSFLSFLIMTQKIHQPPTVGLQLGRSDDVGKRPLAPSVTCRLSVVQMSCRALT